MTSGTAAIHCAIAAMDIEPGAEVVTTTVTDMGGITPILYDKSRPVFTDVDPATLNVTADTVAERITTRTRPSSPRICSAIPATSRGSRRWRPRGESR